MDMTMMESLSRMPPHNMEAEQSVLGCMLLDRESVAAATDFLKAEDFYAESHKEIFESMMDIYDHGNPVDLVTVTEQLRQRGTLEAVGGVAYISDLSLQSRAPPISGTMSALWRKSPFCEGLFPSATI